MTLTPDHWIAILGILLGGTLLKIAQMWFKEKKAKREGYHSDGIAFRKNLIKRLREVEKKEAVNSKEILRLTAENASLQQKLTSLGSYNKRLLTKLDECEKQNS